jgi:prophage regulatory protein
MSGVKRICQEPSDRMLADEEFSNWFDEARHHWDYDNLFYVHFDEFSKRRAWECDSDWVEVGGEGFRIFELITAGGLSDCEDLVSSLLHAMCACASERGIAEYCQQLADNQQEVRVKLLRLREVTDKTGFSRSTLYLYINQGKFPKPVSLGENSVAWVESEVDDWIRERIAERDKK